MEDNWSEVDTSQKKEEPKVEFEVEEKEPEKVEAKPEPIPEPTKEEPQKEEPKELDGIQTKGAEKRIRQLIRQRNEQLKNSYSTKETEFHKVSKLNLDATEKQLKDKLDLARNAYADAFEAQDKEKLLKAQEALNEAQTDLKNVAVTKSKFTEQPTQKEQAPQPTQQQPVQPDPRAVDWQANNEWFGKDNIMTASALAIDAELKNEGYSPNDEDFYDEIDKRMRAAFPSKFTTQEEPATTERNDGSSSPSQVVAGGSRSSPNPKKVKLSQEDVRLANKWGIPLEQYAAEKMKVTKSEGDYTTINMQRGGK